MAPGLSIYAPAAPVLIVYVRSMGSDFALERFRIAQDEHGTFDRALAELRAGRKTSHWMWFVFPQIAGLGHSATSQRFAIGSLDEARAYLADPLLGPRLLECARTLAAIDGATAGEILGPIDALKLRSSMSLFARAEPGEPAFQEVLERYFSGVPDPRTEALLAARA
jgi:uncharacterized protein (DUF1810 family)